MELFQKLLPGVIVQLMGSYRITKIAIILNADNEFNPKCKRFTRENFIESQQPTLIFHSGLNSTSNKN